MMQVMLESYFLQARDIGDDSSRRAACQKLASEIVALRCQLTGSVNSQEQANGRSVKAAHEPKGRRLKGGGMAKSKQGKQKHGIGTKAGGKMHASTQ